MTLYLDINDEAIREAVQAASREVADYQTGSSVAEVADAAVDQLAEQACYLSPEGFLELEGAVQAEVLRRFGLPSGSSDASRIEQGQLEAVAR